MSALLLAFGPGTGAPGATTLGYSLNPILEFLFYSVVVPALVAGFICWRAGK